MQTTDDQMCAVEEEEMQKKNAKEICELTNAVLAKCVRLLEEMRRFTFLLLPSHHPPPPLGNTNNPQHNPN